jgi:arginyl-tRNA synthetase
MLAEQKQDILNLITAAVTPLLAGTELSPTILLERPRDPSHGDFACNIAMQIAKPLKKNEQPFDRCG